MKRDALILRLARKMQKRKMTQQVLADRSGISAPTIYRMESGDERVADEKWAAAAAALGLEYDWESRKIVQPTTMTDAAIDKEGRTERRSTARISTRIEFSADLENEIQAAAEGMGEDPSQLAAKAVRLGLKQLAAGDDEGGKTAAAMHEAIADRAAPAGEPASRRSSPKTRAAGPKPGVIQR